MAAELACTQQATRKPPDPHRKSATACGVSYAVTVLCSTRRPGSSTKHVGPVTAPAGRTAMLPSGAAAPLLRAAPLMAATSAMSHSSASVLGGLCSSAKSEGTKGFCGGSARAGAGSALAQALRSRCGILAETKGMSNQGSCCSLTSCARGLSCASIHRLLARTQGPRLQDGMLLCPTRLEAVGLQVPCRLLSEYVSTTFVTQSTSPPRCSSSAFLPAGVQSAPQRSLQTPPSARQSPTSARPGACPRGPRP